MGNSDNGARSVPDVFGRTGRVRTVAGLLGKVQSRLFALEAEQAANGLADDSPAPGYEEKTVAEVREELRAQEERIVDSYQDLMPDVERLLSAG